MRGVHDLILQWLLVDNSLKNAASFIATVTNHPCVSSCIQSIKDLFACTVELGYNDLGLCDTSFITLYIQWYELIPHKARAFLLAQCDIRKSSTSDIKTLQIIGSNIIFQEECYFENLPPSFSLRGQVLYAFRQLYEFQAWKITLVSFRVPVIKTFPFCDVTRCRLIVTDDSLIALPQKMGPIGCRETSVTNYQSRLGNIAEERSNSLCASRFPLLLYFCS